MFTLESLAKLLKKQSHNRGCIDFNTKEAKIIMDKNGYPVDVTVLERGFTLKPGVYSAKVEYFDTNENLVGTETFENLEVTAGRPTIVESICIK